MSQTKRFVLLAGAALSLGGVNAALGQEAQSSDEVRAIVSEMLADAQSRSSLLAGGGAGHDGSFYLADANGNYRLNIGGQIQFRYLMEFNDEDTSLDEFQPGFQTRRTKLWFYGNIINPSWTYKLQLAFDREGGSANLEEAWGAYKWSNGLSAKWGQFKLPFLREESVSSTRQLAIERSVTNEIFNQDYAQGIQVMYEAKDWHLAGAFSDGFASRNTDFTQGGSNQPTEADLAFTGRFEYLFSGNWEDFDDFTAQIGQKFGAMAGAAFHYQDNANSQQPTDIDLQYLSYTFDISLEGDAWGVYGAFVGSHSETRGPALTGAPSTDFDDFGIVVQGSYRFASNTEIFGRWDVVLADEDRFVSGDDNFNFLTIGVNQYYAGHAAKGTIDLVYSLNETTNLVGFSPWGTGASFNNGGFPNTGVGLLGDTEDGELVIRFQFQLLF